jgi:hypothetical protein
MCHWYSIVYKKYGKDQTENEEVFLLVSQGPTASQGPTVHCSVQKENLFVLSVHSLPFP